MRSEPATCATANRGVRGLREWHRHGGPPLHINRSIFRKSGVSPFQSMQVCPENCEVQAHRLRAIAGLGTLVAGLVRRQHVAPAAVGGHDHWRFHLPNRASQRQILRDWQFLPSPGRSSTIGRGVPTGTASVRSLRPGLVSLMRTIRRTPASWAAAYMTLACSTVCRRVRSRWIAQIQ